MYHYHAPSTYRKVVRVIQSCKTLSQYRSAVNYANLYIKGLPVGYARLHRPLLNEVCEKHRRYLKRRYET